MQLQFVIYCHSVLFMFLFAWYTWNGGIFAYLSREKERKKEKLICYINICGFICICNLVILIFISFKTLYVYFFFIHIYICKMIYYIKWSETYDSQFMIWQQCFWHSSFWGEIKSEIVYWGTFWYWWKLGEILMYVVHD